jgi:6-phosphogluconolactonase
MGVNGSRNMEYSDEADRTTEIRVFPDAAALATGAEELILGLAEEAVRNRKRFNLALCGGSTPRELYARLGEGSREAPWGDTHFYFSDERCVPPEDEQSNYGMAARLFFSKAAIPPANIHRVRGELPPEEAAELYAHEVEQAGRFDLILLGMGEDGHTASLFPGSPVLMETSRKVAAVYAAHLRSWRVTFTLPQINAARNVAFLVSGAGKAETFRQVMAGSRLPARRVKPRKGNLFWLVDEAAYSSFRISG